MKAGKPLTKEAPKSEPAIRNDRPQQKATNPINFPRIYQLAIAKNDPFVVENVFTSDYGLWSRQRCVETTLRMYFTNNYAGYVDLVRAMMRGYDRKTQTIFPECLFEYYCYNRAVVAIYVYRFRKW